MKKALSLLLTLLLLVPVALATAQTVSCPEAGFTLDLPKEYESLPVSTDEPDLLLHLSNGKIDLTVYMSSVGRNASSDLFQILTGDELEYGSVVIGGVEMLYTRSRDDQGDTMMYSWIRDTDNVSLYFLWRGDESSALSAIETIMSTIVFD